MAGKGIWEQSEITSDIPVYNVEFPITGSELVLQVRGDQHIGLNCIDLEEMEAEYLASQREYKDNMFVIDTGDFIENGLKTSIGHNYDLGIPDPDEQMIRAKALQIRLDKDLYGSSYNKMKPITRRTTKHARRIGLLGNHEYRSRKEAGVWLNKELYGMKGVIDGGIRCILNLTVVNKQLKMRKTYTIHMAHRLTNSSAGISHTTMIKNFKATQAKIPCDIYACGHYHRRCLIADHRYDIKGKKHKVMYISNPSPADATEYGTWGLYSPTGAGYYTNMYLPVDPNKFAYGMI